MSATAALVERLAPELLTAPTEDEDAWVVVWVVPDRFRTQHEAEEAADLVHEAITAALHDDLGPLHVQAERLPAPTAAAAPSDPVTTERTPR